jgi:hypothetical protein
MRILENVVLKNRNASLTRKEIGNGLQSTNKTD